MERDKMQLFDNKEIRTVWDEEKRNGTFLSLMLLLS